MYKNLEFHLAQCVCTCYMRSWTLSFTSNIMNLVCTLCELLKMIPVFSCCRYRTFSNHRTSIPLSSLKVTNMYNILCRFYGSPNEQNWMCRLFIFSQIQSHIIIKVSLRILLMCLPICDWLENIFVLVEMEVCFS